MDADGWRRLYQTAIRQSLVGVCYQGVCLLPEGSKPPAEIAMQWACEAESIEAIRRAWLFRIATNEALRLLGRQKRSAVGRLQGKNATMLSLDDVTADMLSAKADAYYDSSDAMVARLQKAGKETFTLENLKKMYFSTSDETTGISERFRFPDEPFTDDITVCV